MSLPSICHKIRLNQDNLNSQLFVTWFLQLQISSACIETICPGFQAVLAVYSLRESHLPWITVEPSSMSGGIQPVLNHYSERLEGRGVGAPALFEHPLNGFPTSQTPRTYTQTCAQRPTFPLQHILSRAFSLTHARIQTHFLNTLTHALITHAFPLPTVTDKQCPLHPSLSLTSLLLPPAPLLSLSSLLWEQWQRNSFLVNAADGVVCPDEDNVSQRLS